MVLTTSYGHHIAQPLHTTLYRGTEKRITYHIWNNNIAHLILNKSSKTVPNVLSTIHEKVTMLIKKMVESRLLLTNYIALNVKCWVHLLTGFIECNVILLQCRSSWMQDYITLYCFTLNYLNFCTATNSYKPEYIIVMNVPISHLHLNITHNFRCLHWQGVNETET